MLSLSLSLLLSRLCTADVDGAVDTITYTQFLNEDGKMEADVTVCKLAADKFIVIATDTMHRHVETWLSRRLDPTGMLHVVSHDVTGGYAQLNIQGPRSRELLQAITDANVEDEMFPFRAARTIAIGHAPVLCARITYVTRPLSPPDPLSLTSLSLSYSALRWENWGLSCISPQSSRLMSTIASCKWLLITA
jgi:heterotetrameric sarcosine oxidase gamma subunit